MVLSFGSQFDSNDREELGEWAVYKSMGRLIADLRNKSTPTAVNYWPWSTSISRNEAAAMGDALAQNTSLQWLRLSQIQCLLRVGHVRWRCPGLQRDSRGARL